MWGRARRQGGRHCVTVGKIECGQEVNTLPSIHARQPSRHSRPAHATTHATHTWYTWFHAPESSMSRYSFSIASICAASVILWELPAAPPQHVTTTTLHSQPPQHHCQTLPSQPAEGVGRPLILNNTCNYIFFHILHIKIIILMSMFNKNKGTVP